ncbi:MAG: hypothetical protein COB26_10245 [Piscirickettsiaceae bacterium]|nr:MAG: hypothetical protein COB26_10245 [Piscirickettsiaceae bacterium]
MGLIPPLHIINLELQIGRDPIYHLSWEAVEISQQLYNKVVSAIINDSRGYCIEDRTLWCFPDFASWRAAIEDKIRKDPTYKLLTWGVQNDIIGIPLGSEKWIVRDWNVLNYTVKKVDSILYPLTDFFRSLQHCTPDCCAISAYSFYHEDIVEKADRYSSLELMGKLDSAITDLDNLDPHVEAVKIEMMNCHLMKSELVDLLNHIISVLSNRESVGLEIDSQKVGPT